MCCLWSINVGVGVTTDSIQFADQRLTDNRYYHVYVVMICKVYEEFVVHEYISQ